MEKDEKQDSPKPGKSMAALFTKEGANEGIEVSITLPDGSDSGETVRVRSTQSDAFRKAQSDENREMVKKSALVTKGELKKDEYDKWVAGRGSRLVASLVADWSLKEKPTRTNVLKCFDQAPFIQDLVDRTGDDQKLFPVGKSPKSTDTPKTKSD